MEAKKKDPFMWSMTYVHVRSTPLAESEKYNNNIIIII
jgi:hypothetical protein